MAETVIKIQQDLCKNQYSDTFFKIDLEPWNQNNKTYLSVDDFYIDQLFIPMSSQGKMTSEKHTNLLDYFNWTERTKGMVTLVVEFSNEQQNKKSFCIRINMLKENFVNRMIWFVF